VSGASQQPQQPNAAKLPLNSSTSSKLNVQQAQQMNNRNNPTQPGLLNPAQLQHPQHHQPQLLQNCTNILQNNLNIHQQQHNQLQLQQQQQPSSIWAHPGIE
jgi:hypothetical protein